MGDEKTQKDDALPVLRLAETTYKGVVTYCFELPEIEKMEIRDDDIWVCSFPRSGKIPGTETENKWSCSFPGLKV